MKIHHYWCNSDLKWAFKSSLGSKRPPYEKGVNISGSEKFTHIHDTHRVVSTIKKMSDSKKLNNADHIPRPKCTESK